MFKEQNPADHGISPEMIETAMSESFESLLDASFTEKEGLEGSVFKGIVTAIDGDQAVIDIGMKSEGRIDLREFGSADQIAEIKIGDTVDVYVDNIDNYRGQTLLSREKARREEVLDVLEKAHADGEKIKGIIFGRVKGGFTVDLQGVLAFLPGSQVDMRPIKDITPLMNIEQELMIIKMDRKRGNLIVSRRAIMDESRSEEREDLLKEIHEGKVLDGVVKNITDYGAFIDLGGLDGLLHITDIAWHRINHPSEVITLGETVKVQVIRFNEETGRVSLGLKQLHDDPWKEVAAKFPIGTKVKGTVTNITEYGAFVELDPGVEGLIHVSEMSWTRKNIHPGKIVSTSQEVEVMVLEIDANKRRISLGYKQCKENPWEAYASTAKVDTVVEGAVRSITDFGIFIGLTEEIDGLIHMSDISWEKDGVEALADYKKGDMIKAKILAVDPEKERISLGIKQLEKDPYEGVDNFNKGDKLAVKVTEINEDGLTVELEEGFTGTIRAVDLGREKAAQNVHAFKVGETLTALVTRVNKRTHTASLSVKALEFAEEKEAVAQYGAGDSGAATLGDAFAALKKTK
ncbi:MAG: small subunit ribosomal protein S1 [Alphaproteobacteria bacterium]|jgi:small subunit ribosomal protein S1